MTAIDWGSAPDWLAALLSGGSLFLALAILTRDMRDRRREHADAFTSWLVQTLHVDGTPSRLTIHAVNSGSRMITRVFVVWDAENQVVPTLLFPDEMPSAMDRNGMDRIGVVRPGDHAWMVRPPHVDDVESGYLMFTDFRGRSWYRSLEGDRYLSRRERRRRLKQLAATRARSS